MVEKDILKVGNNFVSITDKTNILMKHYPQCNWTFVECIVSKYSSKHPRTTFKILGYVILAFTRWVNICRIKKFKKENPCDHRIIFCACGLNYLKKNPKADRPIPTNMKLTVEKEEDWTHPKFVQVSTENERIIAEAGLLWALTICADIAIEPKLSKSHSEYTICKLSFNRKFVYVMTGRQMSESRSRDPHYHVIRQLIAESPLIYTL